MPVPEKLISKSVKPLSPPPSGNGLERSGMYYLRIAKDYFPKFTVGRRPKRALKNAIILAKKPLLTLATSVL